MPKYKESYMHEYKESPFLSNGDFVTLYIEGPSVSGYATVGSFDEQRLKVFGGASAIDPPPSPLSIPPSGLPRRSVAAAPAAPEAPTT